MDIGFQPHSSRYRARGHSSGSTSGETPWTPVTPRIPAVAQIVRSSSLAPSAFITRALIMFAWTSPIVPM